jgi:hypothetical protein
MDDLQLKLNLWADHCLHTLHRMGIKPILHGILQEKNEDDKCMIVPPLFLRTLYSKSSLEDAARFEILPMQMNENNVMDPIKVSILPLPKGTGPSHGTTEGLFHGDSGLV